MAKGFDLDDRDYDRSKFYTRSTNRHDHSKSIQTPFPQDLHGLIHKLAGTIPAYDGSAQALIRDAVFHRVHDLQDMGWQMADDQLAEMQLAAEQENLLARTQLRIALRDGAEKTFRQLIEAGDRNGLLEAIRTHEEMVSRMDEDVREPIEKEIRRAREQLKMMRVS